MRNLLTAKYILIAAAILCAFSALFMAAVIRQTETALSNSDRYDIAWSGANARQELSSLGRFVALYAAFKDPAYLEKIHLFQEIVSGRLVYLESGELGAFMRASPKRRARISDLHELVSAISDSIDTLATNADVRSLLDEIERALKILDRIKNDAQAATTEEAVAIGEDIAHKQLLLNILLSGLLGSCLLLMVVLVKQNMLLTRSSERFAYLANHDPLTGLANRTATKQVLAELSQEPTAGERVGVLVLDLDGFKPINDTLGHLIGDELLTETARRLERVTGARPQTTVSRFGGDEFVILLRNVECASDAYSCCLQVLSSLRQPHDVKGHTLLVDASIGFAVSQPGAVLPIDTLRHADVALNEAKRRGKGMVVEFDASMLAVLTERGAIQQDLAAAMADGQIVPYYQPQVDIGTGRVLGYEALARWHHPVRGFIPPSVFIPIAEASGQIADLGRDILEKACFEIATLPGTADVSVNVSAAQLFHDDFPEYVKGVLRRSGLAATRLRLEITETAVMSDSGKARDAIAQLQALGVLISLDDFGTGYASLSYLREFRFSEVKIDRSFIDAMQSDLKSLALVQTIMDLARRLDLTVVAEGIETPEQAALLRSFGCVRGQGYYFGRPQPMSDIVSGTSQRRESSDLSTSASGNAVQMPVSPISRGKTNVSGTAKM